MKKCPPGVICIENVSFTFVIICFVLILYLLYINTKQNNTIVNNNHPSEKIVIKENQRENGIGGFFSFPSWPYTNDPLINPYNPPLSDERYFVPQANMIPRGAVPINISTNPGAVETNYRQLGILTGEHSKGSSSNRDKILPLMGRPLFTNRDKFQYYTMSDQQNSVKLPILRNGRSCTNEYGCDRLYSGDVVYIEGLNEPYKVKIYDNDTIRYLPSL
jgi:hypothetical protein